MANLDVVCLALVLLAFPAFAAMSCAADADPSLMSTMLVECTTGVAVNSTCWIVMTDATGSYVDWWPGDKTYNGTGAAFTLADGSITFPVDVAIMKYSQGQNYTWNATCVDPNATKESDTGVFMPGEPKSADFAGTMGIWLGHNMSAVFALFIVLAGGALMLLVALRSA